MTTACPVSGSPPNRMMCQSTDEDSVPSQATPQTPLYRTGSIFAQIPRDRNLFLVTSLAALPLSISFILLSITFTIPTSRRYAITAARIPTLLILHY